MLQEELGSMYWFMNTYLILLLDVSHKLTIRYFLQVTVYLGKTIVKVLGGVFICIKETLSASAIPSLHTDAEIVWAKIDVPKEIQFYFVHFVGLLTIYYSHLYSYKNSW